MSLHLDGSILIRGVPRVAARGTAGRLYVVPDIWEGEKALSKYERGFKQLAVHKRTVLLDKYSLVLFFKKDKDKTERKKIQLFVKVSKPLQFHILLICGPLFYIGLHVVLKIKLTYFCTAGLFSPGECVDF